MRNKVWLYHKLILKLLHAEDNKSFFSCHNPIQIIFLKWDSIKSGCTYQEEIPQIQSHDWSFLQGLTQVQSIFRVQSVHKIASQDSCNLPGSRLLGCQNIVKGQRWGEMVKSQKNRKIPKSNSGIHFSNISEEVIYRGWWIPSQLPLFHLGDAWNVFTDLYNSQTVLLCYTGFQLPVITEWFLTAIILWKSPVIGDNNWLSEH